MNHQHPIQRNTTPIPLPTQAINAQARLFFGGSFDPPHLAHATLPPQAATKLAHRLELPENAVHLIYTPAARSPHKHTAPTPDHHRLAMLNLALERLTAPHTIWTQELNDAPLNPGKPSYWADTWSIANQQLDTTPNTHNFFLIGADQALSMHRWHRYDEYWQDAIVILRDDADTTDTLINALEALQVWTPHDLASWRTRCLPLPLEPWSSTQIRSELKATDRAQKTRIEGLDPGVQSYIFKHGLYQ